MFKKLFGFLFKSKNETQRPTASSRTSTGSNQASGSQSAATSNSAPVYGIIARNKKHKGLRKGSKIYVRQIFDDGDRLRIRGTAPNGRKVSLTVNRHNLQGFESEEIPEHLIRHYRDDSYFSEEHEAKMKAEMLGKR